jgi:hypothetical protein
MRFVSLGNISQWMGSGRIYNTNLIQINVVQTKSLGKSFEQVPVQNSASYEQFEQVRQFSCGVLCERSITPFEVFDSQNYTYEQVLNNLGNVLNRF